MPFHTGEVCVTLSTRAMHAYEAFVDDRNLTRWLPFAGQPRVLKRWRGDRISTVELSRQLLGIRLACTLEYRYCVTQYVVRWRTRPSSPVVLFGQVSFRPLDAGGCRMSYGVTIDCPAIDHLLNLKLEERTAAAIAAEFAEHLASNVVLLADNSASPAPGGPLIDQPAAAAVARVASSR